MRVLSLTSSCMPLCFLALRLLAFDERLELELSDSSLIASLSFS